MKFIINHSNRTSATKLHVEGHISDESLAKILKQRGGFEITKESVCFCFLVFSQKGLAIL